MPANDHDKTETAPPQAQLVQMARAHWVFHIVFVAAKLSLADHLAKTPKSAEELAGKTGTHAPSLYRLMRALASLGILTEDATRCFALTTLGDALTKWPSSQMPYSGYILPRSVRQAMLCGKLLVFPALFSEAEQKVASAKMVG
jgi:hypothetical protein